MVSSAPPKCGAFSIKSMRNRRPFPLFSTNPQNPLFFDRKSRYDRNNHHNRGETAYVQEKDESGPNSLRHQRGGSQTADRERSRPNDFVCLGAGLGRYGGPPGHNSGVPDGFLRNSQRRLRQASEPRRRKDLLIRAGGTDRAEVSVSYAARHGRSHEKGCGTPAPESG